MSSGQSSFGTDEVLEGLQLVLVSIQQGPPDFCLTLVLGPHRKKRLW